MNPDEIISILKEEIKNYDEISKEMCIRDRYCIWKVLCDINMFLREILTAYHTQHIKLAVLMLLSLIHILFHIDRNSLAKVCLETVNTHIKQSLQLILIPLHCIRICKVNQAHARLPVVDFLDSSSVCTLYQVSVLQTLFKEVSSLCNIWIDPKDFDKGVDRDSGYIYGPSLPRSWFVGAKFSF